MAHAAPRPLVAQFCAGFAPGDAISAESLNIRRVLREWGFQSEIYSWPDHMHPEVHGECKPVSEFDPAATSLLIYHFSIGSSLTGYALDFPGKKIMIYHNITPGHYFRRYNFDIARQLDEGRKQLASIVDAFDLALADSEFNRTELESLGYRNTGVLPILFEPRHSAIRHLKSEVSLLPLLEENLTTIFFVGRLAPNKKAEDLVRTFGLYQKFYNPRSRLVWVGSWGALELYYLELQWMIRDLGLKNVHFTGHISEAAKLTCFEKADLFASASDHEGFCVPVLESFHHGKPVVAFAAGAIPETVGDAGLVLPERDPGCFAEAIDRVVTDQPLRAALIQRGHARLENHFSFSRVSNLLKEYLKPLLPIP